MDRSTAGPLAQPFYDAVVIGGGVNGAGIARDLAGRGVNVALCEQDDLAQHTSSQSTKLIHGGLRYLEHHEFGLVHKALAERERLLRIAPHIMRPLRFVMPHHPAMRPAWMIRAGLFLYDHLARRDFLPASRALDLVHDVAGAALKPQFTRGFSYFDVAVDDARLVILNARDAAERGAHIWPRTRCEEARRQGDAWMLRIRAANGEQHTLRARYLVNATGPWAHGFLSTQVHVETPLHPRALRLVRGSHIVVPRLFEHDSAYIVQNTDGRILFAIPFEHHFTLVGTTDVEHTGAPEAADASNDEVAYLCEQANRYFRMQIAPTDVVWRYAGVRPLLDDNAGDPSAVTRDYLLERDEVGAPLLTVWGGKLTTYRRLAEEAADLICQGVHRPSRHWTGTAALPGGDLSSWVGSTGTPEQNFTAFLRAVSERYAWLPRALAQRLARAYGSRVDVLLDGARCLTDLGEELAPNLFEAELHYLVRYEWASTAEDVLWRRGKLGLHTLPPRLRLVQAWMRAHATVRNIFPADPAVLPEGTP
ncbi:MAG: glycerol-3-phosphate dehydrogenase [Rhodocyclaceae bacterium]